MFSPDGRTLAAPLAGGRIALWNAADLAAEPTILPGHDAMTLDAEVSPDGTVSWRPLARTGRRGYGGVRDGERIGTLPHDAGMRQVAFSPDGTILATASQDTVVRTWDVRTREPLTRLDRQADVLNGIAFDGSGKRVASAGADGVARLWNLDVDLAVRTICATLDRETLRDEWAAIGADRGEPPNSPD